LSDTFFYIWSEITSILEFGIILWNLIVWEDHELEWHCLPERCTWLPYFQICLCNQCARYPRILKAPLRKQCIGLLYFWYLIWVLMFNAYIIWLTSYQLVDYVNLAMYVQSLKLSAISWLFFWCNWRILFFYSIDLSTYSLLP